MSTRITRHARNRMRLYGISAGEIEQVILEGEQTESWEAVSSQLQAGGRLLRVLWLWEGDNKVVITVYPVRQRKGG